MEKKILQIEHTDSSDFISKILNGFRDILKEHHQVSKDDEILLTREEAAKMLSISLVTLWKLTKDDVIPAFRVGGYHIRYKKSDILNALKQANKFE